MSNFLSKSILAPKGIKTLQPIIPSKSLKNIVSKRSILAFGLLNSLKNGIVTFESAIVVEEIVFKIIARSSSVLNESSKMPLSIRDVPEPESISNFIGNFSVRTIIYESALRPLIENLISVH